MPVSYKDIVGDVKRWIWPVLAVVVAGFAGYQAGVNRGWKGHAAALQEARDRLPHVTVPQSTLNDVLALSPPERSAFVRGYYASMADGQDANYACAVPWFYEKGGAAEFDKLLEGMTVDKNAPPNDVRQKSAGLMLQLSAFNYCANKK